MSDLLKAIIDICKVGAQKHGGKVTVPVYCEDCDALATETWDARPYLNELTHLCECCADKRRDRWLERHS